VHDDVSFSPGHAPQLHLLPIFITHITLSAIEKALGRGTSNLLPRKSIRSSARSHGALEDLKVCGRVHAPQSLFVEVARLFGALTCSKDDVLVKPSPKRAFTMV
jgi:hypothetical protein